MENKNSNIPLSEIVKKFQFSDELKKNWELRRIIESHEQVYEEFWKDIIEPNGQIDMDALKRELFDYWTFMNEASKVYYAVTGGRISKVNTNADTVINEIEDYFERRQFERSIDKYQNKDKV